MNRDRREQRIGTKYLARVVFILSSVVIVLLATVSWKVITALPAERITIVVAGDPARVLSWDDVRRQLTVIAIPADVYLDGVFGVGSLPLASLRKLEALDIKKKGIYAASLGDALAIPIAGVDLPPLLQRGGSEGGLQFMKDTLSPFELSHWWGSDLSFPLRFRLWWILTGLRPDAVKTIDLESQGVFRNELLADGSRVRVFDVNRFDVVIGNRLEVDAVRREELRIRVINTTDVAGLGNRAARVLSHAGMMVVSVESEPFAQRPCTIHAKKEMWAIQTSRFIQRVFQCSMTEADADDHVDLTVKVGGEYARKFTFNQ